MSFGSTLSRLRRARGWSQEALALRAGLSQRHVSFLETGRSQPGQRSISKLVDAMALKGWEHRALFASIAPVEDAVDTRSHDVSFVERFVEQITPWPAYAFRPDGSLLACNNAMASLLALPAPDEDLWHITSAPEGANIYDLVFHPRGLVRWMINPDEVIPETLRRLTIEASHDATLNSALSRIEAYNSVHRYRSIDHLPPGVLIERYEINDTSLALISVLSHLASPGELALDQLRIESFVPADQASHDFLSKI